MSRCVRAQELGKMVREEVKRGLEDHGAGSPGTKSSAAADGGGDVDALLVSALANERVRVDALVQHERERVTKLERALKVGGARE